MQFIVVWVLGLFSLSISDARAQVDCQAIMNALLTGQPGPGSPQNAQELANIYNTFCLGGNRSTPRPSNQIDCGNGSSCPLETTCCGSMCCGSGSYCSQYGCTPNGAVECGGYYCQPGQKCAVNHNGCYPADVVDCGSHTCNPGYVCSRGAGCVPENTVDCGGGSYCQAGTKCSRNSKRCDPEDAVDCGSHSCSAGMKCGSGDKCLGRDAVDCGGGDSCDPGDKCSRGGGCVPKQSVDCGGGHSCSAGMRCGSGSQCLARDAIDCGGGHSCPAGNVCITGGTECLTPKELADRRSAEKKAKEEAAAAATAAKAQAAADNAAAARAAQVDKERQAYSQRIAPSLCRKKPSCVMTVVQAASLSSTGQSTKLATINATWTATNTKIYKIISGSTQQQSSATVLKATGTPVQTISIGPIGKPATVGTPVAIGSPVNIWNVLKNLGNSKLVQIGLDSASAAGQDAAKLLMSGGAVTTLGYASNAADLVRAYQTGGWLLASQTVAEKATAMAGGGLGAALMPENPLVGKAIGTAISEGAVYAGTTYVSPVLGNMLFNADPKFWMQ